MSKEKIMCVGGACHGKRAYFNGGSSGSFTAWIPGGWGPGCSNGWYLDEEQHYIPRLCVQYRDGKIINERRWLLYSHSTFQAANGVYDTLYMFAFDNRKTLEEEKKLIMDQRRVIRRMTQKLTSKKGQGWLK